MPSGAHEAAIRSVSDGVVATLLTAKAKRSSQVSVSGRLSPLMVVRMLSVRINAGDEKPTIAERHNVTTSQRHNVTTSQRHNVIMAALAGFSMLEFASAPLENTDERVRLHASAWRLFMKFLPEIYCSQEI